MIFSDFEHSDQFLDIRVKTTKVSKDFRDLKVLKVLRVFRDYQNNLKIILSAG